jgi:hypothetical protein
VTTSVAVTSVARQALVGGAAAVDVPGHVVDGDAEGGALDQHLLAAGEPAQPDLGALEVGEHADGATDAGGRGTDVREVRFVVGVLAVAHVQAGDIHAGLDQLDEALGR